MEVPVVVVGKELTVRSEGTCSKAGGTSHSGGSGTGVL